MKTVGRNLLLIIVGVPVLALIAFSFGLFPWSLINCTIQEVDVCSGRVHHVRYLLFVPVKSRVEDSALTKALSPEDIAGTRAEWHRVLVFSPGLQHSPHFFFHSAINQIRELETAWQLAKFTLAARRSSAKRVLQLWQQSGNDRGAAEYLRALSELAASNGQRKIDVNDLPAGSLPREIRTGDNSGPKP